MSFVKSDIVNNDHPTGKSNVPSADGWRSRATVHPHLALQLKTAGTPVVDMPDIQNPAMFRYPRRSGTKGATQARLDLQGLQRTIGMNFVGPPALSLLQRLKKTQKVSTVSTAQLAIHQQPGMFHSSQRVAVPGAGRKKTGKGGLGDARTNSAISAVHAHIARVKANQGGYLSPKQEAMVQGLHSRIARVVSGMSGLGDDLFDTPSLDYSGIDTSALSTVDLLPTVATSSLIAPVSIAPIVASGVLTAPGGAAQTPAQIAQLNAYNQALTDVGYGTVAVPSTVNRPTASATQTTAQVTASVAALARALAGGGTPSAAQIAQAQAQYAAQQAAANPFAALTSGNGMIYIGLALVGVLVISMVAGRKK